MPSKSVEIAQYLGNDLAGLEGKVSAAVLGKLNELDASTTAKFWLPAIDYLFLAHHLGNKSHTDLAKEAGIGKSTVRKIFVTYGLPIVDRATAARRKWDDADFRQEQIQTARATMYRLKQDPNFRAKEAAARSATFRNLWDNSPEFWQAVADRARTQSNERWQDSGFRRRQHDGLERELERRWHDPDASPGFRKRFADTHAESTRQLWENPEFREKIAEASRDARYRPEGLNSRMRIPSIHGYRRDIGFYAQSMMEANLARVFMLNHASVSRRQTFRLNVPREYRNLIGQEQTEITIDFAIKDRMGKVTLFEIVAHPLEQPVGSLKLELLKQQYQQYTVVAVDQGHYEDLSKQLSSTINKSPRFCGWETTLDNLRTNPAKYM